VLNQDWYLFFLSMLPFTELRASIPLGIALEIYPWRVFWIAVVGNLVPVLPILCFLRPLEKFINRLPYLGNCLQAFLASIRHRGEKISKYGLIGLLLFVLIPLPGTGVWTGTLLAWLFGFPYFTSFLMISLGVLGAGLLVTLASLGVWQAVRVYGPEIFFIFCLVFLAWFIFWLYLRRST
jgi:uncharacterized membrane protein